MIKQFPKLAVIAALCLPAFGQYTVITPASQFVTINLPAGADWQVGNLADNKSSADQSVSSGVSICDCARLRKAQPGDGHTTKGHPQGFAKVESRTNRRKGASQPPQADRGIPRNHVTRLAMKLMALTFVRTSELIGAKWSEFDLELSRWDIPGEHMKMRTPHIVPLARHSLDALNLL